VLDDDRAESQDRVERHDVLGAVRQHQRDAVARILTDGRTLLAHAVGAGKTATMVMAAMELRRLGSVTKPAVVVTNHLLGSNATVVIKAMWLCVRRSSLVR
jgi:N12 class adenine-specific DNA methylase